VRRSIRLSALSVHVDWPRTGFLHPSVRDDLRCLERLSKITWHILAHDLEKQC
jgi:hypothetical protein